MERPRILCITRTYPPVVGGMERLSFEFTEALAARTTVQLVANRHGKRALPWFLRTAALRLRQLAPTADVIHLGDPLLTVLLPFLPGEVLGQRSRMPPERVERAFPEPGMLPPAHVLRTLAGTRVGLARKAKEAPASSAHRPALAVTIHGLDLLYPHPFYQALLRRFLPRVDLALCISRFVESEVRKRFPRLRTLVVTPGLRPVAAPPSASRRDLEHALGRPLPSGPLLLAVARLVPRKGLAWFVAEVLPKIPSAALLIVGEGPARERIVAAARRANVAGSVLFAGTLSPDALQVAYRVADLLIMPNIPVPGDAEGFGLVALEAAAAGLPVVAANLEGIPDAVIKGETGVLVPPGDAAAWVRAVSELLQDQRRRSQMSARAPDVVRTSFSWDRKVEEVLAAFGGLQSLRMVTDPDEKIAVPAAGQRAISGPQKR